MAVRGLYCSGMRVDKDLNRHRDRYPRSAPEPDQPTRLGILRGTLRLYCVPVGLA